MGDLELDTDALPAAPLNGAAQTLKNEPCCWMKYSNLPSADHRGLSAHPCGPVTAVHVLLLPPPLGITKIVDVPGSRALTAWKQIQRPFGENLPCQTL